MLDATVGEKGAERGKLLGWYTKAIHNDFLKAEQACRQKGITEEAILDSLNSGKEATQWKAFTSMFRKKTNQHFLKDAGVNFPPVYVQKRPDGGKSKCWTGLKGKGSAAT